MIKKKEIIAQKTQRDPVFDIFRGIGIYLMVLGHSGFPFTPFICLFHMPIFFILSGIFFTEKHYNNVNSVLNFIKSKIKTLYIPYVIYVLFLILIHNFLLDINIYTNNPDFLSLENGAKYGLTEHYTTDTTIKRLINAFFFISREQLAGALWFLQVLFFVSISICIGHFFGKKLIKSQKYFNIIRFIIFTLTLIIGFMLKKKGLLISYNLSTMFSCCSIFYLGILYRKYNEEISRILNKIGELTVATISFFILYLMNTDEIIVSLSTNKYPNPIFLIISSIAGFFFILSISKFINKINFLNIAMSYIGKHTISILLFHFVALKLITYIQIMIFSKPSYMLAAFPTLVTENFWWILYSIIGTGIPLIFASIWEYTKKIANLSIKQIYSKKPKVKLSFFV